jgi:hypothetical protein
MTWKAGDTVKTIPSVTARYENESAWVAKLSKTRTGKVVEVPHFTRVEGQGTLLIEWESLTGEQADPKQWRRWIHSTAVERVTP